MFTDIVGYTALTQLNEAKALELLERHNRLLRPIFPRFRGREVKAIGDAFLVEFESALDATECAVEIQRFLREDNGRSPPEDRVRVRVGVHLGDVVHTEADVFGDAVNIASRIEPLAEPEGVCVTGPVFELVRNKVPYAFEQLDPKPLKNVRFPPAVYRIVLPWSGTEPPLAARSARNRIAVLPLANISPNADDAYFADGLTDELITVLSRLPGVRVIARASVDVYRERRKPVREIGSELSVDTVLAGSVRKAGDKVRIAVQLVRTETEEHVWSESYDRRLDDIFAIQTEIAQTVGETLRSRLRAEVGAGPPTASVVGPDSYLAYLKGRSLLRDRTEGALRGAATEFQQSIELDRRNARAYVGLADAKQLSVFYLRDPKTEGFAEARRLVDTALELEPNLAEAHASRAFLLLADYCHSDAESAFRKAIGLNPSYPTAHHWYALLLQDLGRFDESLRELSLAEEADPFSGAVLSDLIWVLIGLGRFDEARTKIQKLGRVEGHGPGYHANLVWYLLATSDWTSAREHLDWLRQAQPADPDVDVLFGFYHALRRDRDEARAALRRLEALPESNAGRENSLAWTYALLGDLDECFRWLEHGVDKKSVFLGAWRLQPLAAHARGDPRFQGVLRRAGLN